MQLYSESQLRAQACTEWRSFLLNLDLHVSAGLSLTEVGSRKLRSVQACPAFFNDVLEPILAELEDEDEFGVVLLEAADAEKLRQLLTTSMIA